MAPDEYDAFRRKLTRYELGLYFELGRAREQGEVPEKGWVRQFTIKTDLGPRVLDSARTDGRGTQGVERKSGRVNERDTMRQLERERDGLESGKLTQSRWESVAGEKIPPAVAAELQAMARDFHGRFQHVAISRADALRAMKLGQSLVSKQLELVRAYELVRADRARKRLEKIREIVRARERAEKEPPAPKREVGDQRAQEKERQQRGIAKEREREPAEQARTREDNRDKAKPPAVAREHTDPTLKTKDVREREEAQARELVNSLGLNLSNEQKEQVQAILRQGRENQRKDLAREIESPRPQQPPAPPPVPRRTPEQERDNARALAKEAGLSPEIMGILGLNTNNPPKMLDAEQARTHADAQRERSIHQKRERERAEREREREGRYRRD